LIRVEEYLGEPAFAELRGAWQALHAEVGGPPFLSPLWLEAWHRHLGGPRRPRLVAAWRKGKLVGLLPLFEERTALVSRLGFLGEKTGGADYLDLLALPAMRGEVAEAIAEHLAGTGGFDVLDLFELPADSALLPSFHRRALADEGFVARIEPRYVCPQVDLHGSWEEVLSRSRRASNFRRRRKQVEAMGGEHRLVLAASDAPAALERFLRLHERRWEGEGGSEGIGTRAHVAFHHEVVPKLARAGWLRFDELWVEGECRASIYGIECGSTYYFYQSGYDPDWSAKSVGLVLLGMSMERAIGRGMRVYDFLHGVEPYKLDWATRATQTLRLQVHSRSPGALWLRGAEGVERRARGWIRSFLPKGAVDYLRRHRRARQSREGGEPWRVGMRPGAI